MRRAHNAKFHEANGTKIGIFTGADFCAEHEWGIKNLRQSLGMPTDAMGVASRTNGVGKHVELNVSSNGEFASLTAGTTVEWRYHNEKQPKAVDLWKKGYPSNKEGDLMTEWDEGSFRVVVKGKDNVALLKKLHEAISECRCYIGLGGQGVFDNGGLNIIPVADLPAEAVKTIEEADVDRKKLREAAAATGIEAKLTATHTKAWNYPASGCKWYALSPRWASENEQKRTKYPVVFWLNPQSQDVVSFGWFTVEELEQWAEGKGPCIKANKKD